MRRRPENGRKKENMKIVFNHKFINVADRSNLYQLMSRRNFDLTWSLVSVNDRIVRHELWDNLILREGDRVEVLSLTYLGEGI